MISLLNLDKEKSTQKKSKRIGRGYGSGVGGHYVGRGGKGQTAREGAKPHVWFEGGQTPLVRRLPFIHGFKAIKPYDVLILNFNMLEKLSKNVKIITPEVVKEITKIKFDFVKVMGTGTLSKKLDLKGLWYTKKAKEKIEKAGGSVE